jgi:hypothetical protein
MNQDKKKENRGRIRFLSQDPDKMKAYFKEHADIYYSNPVNRQKQNERMRLYRMKNRENISKKKRMKNFEIRLKKCWIIRGLIL